MLSRKIAAAESRRDILAALAQAAQAYRFAHVSLIRKPLAGDHLLADLLVESTLPAQFVREFDRNRYLSICPIMPSLFCSILPRTWTLDELQCDVQLAYPREIAELMHRFRLLTTAVMPVHSLDGENFLLRFDGERQPLHQAELNEISMIALHAFDALEKMRRRQHTQLSNPLSNRELEVLRWTAQGKTSVEIGRILSLSDHTVNTHMTNAIKKLDCVNRPQLVAKAMRLGLIA